MEVNTKMKLDEFTEMMTGHFDNKEQFDKMQAEGKTYPYAEHVNTICNDKIKNLPEDFNGRFVVEESYYETNGKRHASPHLFLKQFFFFCIFAFLKKGIVTAFYHPNTNQQIYSYCKYE